MKSIYSFFWSVLFLFLSVSVISCKDDDVPPIENEEEVITMVTLTFTPVSGNAISFTYSDPDGEGSTPPTIDPIVLAANTPYTMTIELTGVDGEDITDEILLEADEHMFFFGWTGAIFSNPSGNGNLTARSGTVNYADSDTNNQPLGLATTWTTGDPTTGTFTTILKHQPDVKSATSTVNDGETDVEITWNVTVQ